MAKEDQILFKKFELIDCFKKDEFSAVYLATHIYLEKKVFLKILNTNTIADNSVIERFKREAKILANMDHPNIIKVYDFGMYEEFFYISFEYFDSQNLREFLAKNTVDTNTKTKIMTELVKGLDFVHKNDVLHRDLKPENILVNSEVEVKLTDFGLALDSKNNFVTQKYAIVGTPAYMSPEQINGELLTKKSDLFSLGLCLFELFEGKNPFLGKDSNETINNILSFDSSKLAFQSDEIPEDLRIVILNLLETEPEKRKYATSDILTLLNVDNSEIHKTKKQKITLKILLPFFLLIIALSVWHFNKSNNPEKVNSEIIDTSEIPASISDTGSYMSDKTKEDNVDNNLIENGNSLSSTEIEYETPEIKSKKQEIVEVVEDGEIFVKCYPWAKVSINDEFYETTPMTENINLQPGKYLLSLNHPDYTEYSDSISISSNLLTYIEVNLDTLFGYFDCKAYPWGELFINNESFGVTPFKTPIPLEEGKYLARLVNNDYDVLEKEILISKNDTLRLKFDLAQGIIN